MTLTIIEHKSSSYAPRTYHNASQGVTLAVAVDFNTAGERLTHKASNGKIVQVQWGTDYDSAARELYKMLRKHQCHVLNIAGNSIATLSKHGVSQIEANQFIYDVVKLVNTHWKLDRIVSGGQTGMDVAGLVTGVALGIETIGTWPKGMLIRLETGKDISWSEDECRDAIDGYVKQLM